MLKKLLSAIGFALLAISLIFYIWAGAIVSEKQNVIALYSTKDISYGTTIKTAEEARGYICIKEVPKYLVTKGAITAEINSGITSILPTFIRDILQRLGVATYTDRKMAEEQLINQCIGKMFQENINQNQQITSDMMVDANSVFNKGIGMYSILIESTNIGGGTINNGESVDIWVSPASGQSYPLFRQINVIQVNKAGDKYLITFYMDDNQISTIENAVKIGKIFLVKR
ncbi:MAG: hypothetical protein ACPLVF_01980 [Thermovenabulum sp.]|uniref:hypothetical protein n=1 Tax=Thermovenabulum sp. TaxID=3100335 RepID=UPI003C7C2483